MPANDNSPASSSDITAAVLVIGDEILSGRTKDTNSGYIADYMTAIGIRLREVRVVGDEEDVIVEALNALRSRYTYVFTTGGIGPTHDDITADAVAKAFGVKLEHNPQAVALLREYIGADRLNEARMRMARVPEGGELVDNPISKAPGFMIGNVIVMAGIPRIMHVMLDAVSPRLKKGRKILTRAYRVEHPEGDVALVLNKVQEACADVQMGSYPFYDKGSLGTHVVLRTPDEGRLEAASAVLLQALTEAGLTRHREVESDAAAAAPA